MGNRTTARFTFLVRLMMIKTVQSYS